jgi:hypothetical protein
MDVIEAEVLVDDMDTTWRNASLLHVAVIAWDHEFDWYAILATVNFQVPGLPSICTEPLALVVRSKLVPAPS